MTAEIIQIKSRMARKPRTKKQPPSVFEKSNFEIFAEVQEDVLGAWRSAAVNDSINDFIKSKIPTKARDNGADYVNDLNALAKIEQKLKMKLAIFWPGCTVTNPVGWLAAFHRGKETFTTPPDMASEGYARAMNIVLYITFEQTLKTIGRN